MKAQKTLVSDYLSAGYHQFNWNATDENNLKVGSGVYLYKIRSGSKIITKKMIFAK